MTARSPLPRGRLVDVSVLLMLTCSCLMDEILPGSAHREAIVDRRGRNWRATYMPLRLALRGGSGVRGAAAGSPLSTREALGTAGPVSPFSAAMRRVTAQSEARRGGAKAASAEVGFANQTLLSGFAAPVTNGSSPYHAALLECAENIQAAGSKGDVLPSNILESTLLDLAVESHRDQRCESAAGRLCVLVADSSSIGAHPLSQTGMEDIKRAQGAQLILRRTCSPTPTHAPAASEATSQAAGWPAAHRLLALTTLLRLSNGNWSGCAHDGRPSGFLELATVAGVVGELASAAEKVGLSNSACVIALGALTRHLPPLALHGDENAGGLLDGAVERLAELCVRDAHACVGDQGGGAVAEVASLAAFRGGGTCVPAQVRTQCRTALLLLKACAQGGGGALSGSIAVAQLAFLSSALEREVTTLDHDPARVKANVVQLVLHALAASCQMAPGGDQGVGGKTLWIQAMQVWDRADSWGVAARGRWQTLAALARVLRAAVLVEDADDRTWHVHATSLLVSRAAAVAAAAAVAEGSGGNEEKRQEIVGDASKPLGLLLAAVAACARGLGARAGTVAYALASCFVRQHGAVLQGQAVLSLLHCTLASTRSVPNACRGDHERQLDDTVAVLLTKSGAWIADAPAAGDRMQWLHALLDLLDMPPRPALDEGAGVGVFVVPGLVAHVRGILRSLQHGNSSSDTLNGKTEEGGGLLAERTRKLALVLSRLRGLAGSHVLPLAVLDALMCSYSMLLLSISCDAGVEGESCPWKIGSDWFAVLLAQHSSNGKVSSGTWGGDGERARCAEVWIWMCLEAVRRDAQGGAASGRCSCGALKGGGLAAAREALSKWHQVQGPMSLQLVSYRLAFLLPEHSSLGREAGGVDAVEGLVTLASRLIDGAHNRNVNRQHICRLATDMVRRLSLASLQALQEVSSQLAAHSRHRHVGQRMPTEYKEAEQRVMRVVVVLEQLLVKCHHRRVRIATPAVQALAVMLSHLSDLREEASKRAASTQGGRDAKYRVDWWPMASVAQAAVQSWHRVRPPWVADLPIWEGGDRVTETLFTSERKLAMTNCSGPEQGLILPESPAGHLVGNDDCDDHEQPVSEGDDRASAGLIEDAEESRGKGEQFQGLSAEAATALLRLMRKGLMADRWQGLQVARHAHGLIAAVPPANISASLAAEMLLTLGGKQGGQGEESLVLAWLERARGSKVAHGNVYRAAWLALGRSEHAHSLLQPLMREDGVSLMYLEKKVFLEKVGRRENNPSASSRRSLDKREDAVRSSVNVSATSSRVASHTAAESKRTNHQVSPITNNDVKIDKSHRAYSDVAVSAMADRRGVDRERGRKRGGPREQGRTLEKRNEMAFLLSQDDGMREVKAVHVKSGRGVVSLNGQKFAVLRPGNERQDVWCYACNERGHFAKQCESLFKTRGDVWGAGLAPARTIPQAPLLPAPPLPPPAVLTRPKRLPVQNGPNSHTSGRFGLSQGVGRDDFNRNYQPDTMWNGRVSNAREGAQHAVAEMYRGSGRMSTEVRSRREEDAFAARWRDYADDDQYCQYRSRDQSHFAGDDQHLWAGGVERQAGARHRGWDMPDRGWDMPETRPPRGTGDEAWNGQRGPRRERGAMHGDWAELRREGVQRIRRDSRSMRHPPPPPRFYGRRY